MKAVIFRSTERFDAFRAKVSEYGIETVILDFENQNWVGYDYREIDFIIYYPSFNFSSNHPLALQRVYDNVLFLHEHYPHLKIYPDPGIVRYYNDKYRQYLFLKKHDYPIPETIPLFSEQSVNLADEKLGYPMIVKNRFGAGGGTVFRIHSRNELLTFYRISKMDLWHWGAVKYFGRMFFEKLFYWQLIRAKNVRYPFFSPPLLAQKFVKIDRDLKTVVGNCKVVESHWRLPPDETTWKMNIDGGGIGLWAKVPDEAISLSEKLARELQASWLNIDLIISEGKFLITEFSPVWHHYAYKEKPSFVYKDDYNIDTPLEVALDLERIIVESLIDAVNKSDSRPSSLK